MLLYNLKNPVVSVILPTYNREKLLKRAIRSVVDQRLKDWELIIVDDGSGDSTFDLVDDFIGKYPNIRYLKHSHRKLPRSMNTGIAASAGKYISFIGSDDEFDEAYLEERLNYMEGHPDVDLIHGGVKIIGDPFVKDKNNPDKLIHLSECIIGGTFFGKKNLFLDLNGFNDIPYSEDSEFYERAVKKFKVNKVDLSPYIYYRDTEDSICNTI